MANEKRLIDLDVAKKSFDDIPPFIGMTGKCVQKMLDGVPTVDAVEVVHGEWLNTKFTTELLCSNCFELSFVPITKIGRKPYNYCPNCGAKMDLEV